MAVWVGCIVAIHFSVVSDCHFLPGCVFGPALPHCVWVEVQEGVIRHNWPNTNTAPVELGLKITLGGILRLVNSLRLNSAVHVSVCCVNMLSAWTPGSVYTASAIQILGPSALYLKVFRPLSSLSASYVCICVYSMCVEVYVCLSVYVCERLCDFSINLQWERRGNTS